MQGLALINGTQLITGLGLEALHRAELIGKQADVVAALSLEALRGHPGVFDEGKTPRECICSVCAVANFNLFTTDIHDTRPHKGQKGVAKTMRALLDRRHYDYDAAADLEGDYSRPIDIMNKVGTYRSPHLSFTGGHIQDSYCLRCIPQVHGVVLDTIEFVRGILKTEVNSTLDNPVCHYCYPCS